MTANRHGHTGVEVARGLLRAGERLLPASTRRSLRRRIGRVDPWEPGARLRPPRCPAGMVVAPPDFVGVGVQKAGTTWWYELLASHPGIYDHPSAHKERHFFVRFFDQEFVAADIEEYHRWFPRPPGRLAGEWTPDYMLHFWIPRLLKTAAPETKLLVLLRDPVERIVSGLTHVAARQPIPDARSASEAYLRGRYLEQLTHLLRHFDRSQILVQQYERCRVDPKGELARTLSFLGLDAVDSDRPLDTPVNVTSTPKVRIADGTRDDLVALYGDEVLALVADFPEIDISLWPNFAFLA